VTRIDNAYRAPTSSVSQPQACVAPPPPAPQPTLAELCTDPEEGYQNKGHDQPLQGSQLEIVSILLRHQDQIPGNRKQLEERAQDQTLPEDLRTALQGLLGDPSLLERLDTSRKNKVDGKYNADDLLKLADRQEVKDFVAAKAQTYVENYVPSTSNNQPAPAEGAEAAPAPRPMTKDDALRELYMYSDSLEKKRIGFDDFEKIVNGKYRGKQLPPQVIAAAQYFLQNRNEWRETMGTDNNTSRANMCNQIAKQVNFTATEMKTIEDLKADSAFFFKDGALTREKLQKMLDDPGTDDKRKAVCQQLLDNPLLFGMLDNAKRGHGGGGFFSKRKADDGKIGEGDLDALLKKMTPANRTPPPEPPARANTKMTAEQKRAMADMQAGAEDDPAIKKPKGNGGFFKLAAKVLDVVAKVYDVASMALGALSKIPVLGPVFAAASVAAAGYAGALRVGKTAIEGGDVKAALKQMAIDVAVATVSAVTLPGAGRAAVTAAKEAGKEVVKKAAQEGAERAVTKATTEVAEVGARKAGTEAAEASARGAGNKVAASGATQGARRSAVRESAEEGTEQMTRAQVRLELRAAIREEARARLEDYLMQKLEQQCNKLGIPNPLTLKDRIKAELQARAEQAAMEYLDKLAEKAGLPNPLMLKSMLMERALNLREELQAQVLGTVLTEMQGRGIPTGVSQLLEALPEPLKKALNNQALLMAIEMARDPQAAFAGKVPDEAHKVVVAITG
jgi:NolX protein